jgi:two-component system NtrC family response regulator
MPAKRILLIEDDPAGRELAAFNLEKAGHPVDAVASGEAGLEQFDPGRHGMVITDIRMPGVSGMDVLGKIKERSPATPVLVITAYGDVETAVEAMKLGAVDFIGKPFNRDHLLLVVERALAGRRLEQEVHSLRSRLGGVERPIVRASAAMEQVVEMADRVAASDATVLITGESGTGKELIARRIHSRSDRADGPFVPVNVAAMPAELLESELFGHEKGAFTGATRARKGRFRQADQGTIFLDEVGEIPPALQGKLLRALQERAIEVVGADVPVGVDVRVVAATNRDLAAEVKAGRFRDDLFFRLNVVEINVPPLRGRADDVDALVEHFVAGFGEGRELSIGADLLERLRARTWPGNVRELENACQRLVVLCPGSELRIDDLPPDVVGEGAAAGEGALLDGWPPLPEDGLSLVDLEKRVIERVLRLKGGNVTQAAVYLGVPRHVLAYRMEKYGIPRK